jgi:tetratricopeptide (TPR) repeat protein
MSAPNGLAKAKLEKLRFAFGQIRKQAESALTELAGLSELLDPKCLRWRCDGCGFEKLPPRKILRFTILTAWLGCAAGFGVAHGAWGQATEDRLRFFEERVKKDDADFIAWNGLADLCLLRQRETGNDEWLVRAEQAAAASLKAARVEFNPAGLALRVRINLALHRFAAARDGARQLREIEPGRSSPLAGLGDALLELGDLDEAAKVIDDLAGLEGESVTAQSRLARLALLRGRHKEARSYFAKALLATPASQPLTVAWCHVQLGELAFRRGDWEGAEKSYQAALQAFPDWWSAREHVAELRGAQGRVEEALALYTEVVAQAPRPDLLQAAGDLLLFVRRPDEARAWHDRARAAYFRAAESHPELPAHHLAGFFSDSQEDATEAVKWARRDLELRHSGYAWDALAWGLNKQGDIPASLEASQKALATGLADAHVLYHAAMIHISAGEIAPGQALLRRCAEVNPRFNTFHAHR